jgi:hypothetical protein
MDPQISARKTRKKSKYTTKQPKTIPEWLAAKVKYPFSYGVTPEGMLVAPPSKPGDIEKVFVLEPRVFAPKEHIASEFEKRGEEIRLAEEQFTEARRNLQRVVQAYRQGLTTTAEVVIANQQTKEAEAFLIEKAVAPRSIVTVEPTPEIREILLNNQYIKNKFPDTVYCLKRATFPWTNFYINPKDIVVAEGAAEPLEPAVPTETVPSVTAAKRGAIIAAKTAKRKIRFAI